MGKLTPAIRDLKRCLNPKTGQTYSDAIRILEAAERIDRKGALQFLDSYTRPEDYKPHQYPSIRALIESLPDPSKEPKDQNKEEDKQTPPRGGENQGGE